ncbi:MAG: hypothetical protein HC822_12245 [Oscillochloris sp.]|nr:hypothetical protein [Oscillochloris sp.]
MLERNIISAASTLDAIGLRYTSRQLYYQVCRDVTFPLRDWLLRLARPLPFTLKPPLRWSHFAAALAALRPHTVRLPGLLSAAPPVAPSPLPELRAYGLPRLLICADAEIAAMLRANHLPSEIGCPILSLAEASPLAEVYLQMLRVAAGQVIFLHPADRAGLRAAARLPQHLALPDGVAWIAPGLRPIHALRMHLFAIPAADLRSDFPHELSASERRWLRRQQAELHAIAPLRLLRVIRRLLLAEPAPPPILNRLRRLPQLGFMSWPE